MKLQAASRVYVQWPVAGIPEDAAAMQVRFDGGAWFDLEYVRVSNVPVAVRILVAGPEFAPPVGDVHVYPTLALGSHVVEFRFADNPEVIITNGGTIDVVTVAPAEQLTWGVTVEEVAALAPHVNIDNEPELATDPIYAGSNRKVRTGDVARWIMNVSAMVDARLRARTALTDELREVVHHAAHTVVLNGAAEYMVAAAYPMKAGVNESTAYSGELRRRYEEGLALLFETVDAWLEPGGTPDPTDPTAPVVGGGITGYSPPTAFPDIIRW